MSNIQYEITREPPDGAATRFFVGGKPILYAYGCALLENCVDDYFVYKVVNLDTNKSVTLCRRKTPIAPREIERVAERIRDCAVAGAGRLEVERPYGRTIPMTKCREILDTLFRELLPEYGYAVREEQIALAEGILDNIYSRGVILAEAEVGTGKTLAYLAAAVLAKRGRLIDFWNKAYYPKMSYVDMAHMPIVIATSSIALQKAILNDYIPALSKILLDCGVITSPITAVLRKGREHYVCERKLRSCLGYESDSGARAALQKLLTKANAPLDVSRIDIAEIEGLDRYTKRRISVPGKCAPGCPCRDSCAYLRFREYANNPAIDIQVVNHNYFLADMKLREASGKRSLIPNYQAVVIDEAHKLLAAARTMYGYELSSFTLPEIKDNIFALNIKGEAARKLARKSAKKLSDESRRLFKGLCASKRGEESGDAAARFTVDIDKDAARHLRNLRNISDALYELLASEEVSKSGEDKRSDILWDLAAAREQLAALARYVDHICWLELPDMNVTAGSEQELRLGAIPKDIDARLFASLWSRGIPTILTSGTLSTGGDFSHVKKTLGLERVGKRLAEISKPSPFNYRDNSLLYVSESVPFPDLSSRDYIAAVAAEIRRLIFASNGHAAVLFTSYKALDLAWEILRDSPFPMFRLDKGGVRALERFRQSGNGVLFAAGALWDGIDIPGDALSMLIVARLPFQVPDPIGEYEQSLYADMFEYKARVVVPEMLIKLKQGFGRIIRTETDTGVVAILDSRANSRGAYRDRVLAALPDCRVTGVIDDVIRFIEAKKTSEYFK